MYRIYDKESAILQVQCFLRVVGDRAFFVAPSGVYDENTRLSVIDFQNKNRLSPSGVVDSETFRLLYESYTKIEESKKIKRENSHIADFPILPGSAARGMEHINRMLAELLNYYGHIHNLNGSSNYYTAETSKAVDIIRKIYNMAELDYIDEALYQRIKQDTAAIQNSNLYEGFE